MSLARSLRDSIQLSTAAGVKEQRRIVYLKTVLISHHDGERAPQNFITTIGKSRLTIDIYE